MGREDDQPFVTQHLGRLSGQRVQPPGAREFSSLQWSDGLTALFDAIPSSHTERIFLGNIPLLAQSAPTCLSTHLDAVQACSTPVAQAYRHLDQIEFSIAESLHVRYIDPTPWFCSSMCTPIVGPYDVYMDRFHVSAAYATYLQKALAQAVFSPIAPPTHFSVEVTTSVVRPSDGATLSGGYWLAAIAVLGNSPVVSLDFRLSGGGLSNGHYKLQTVAYDAAGKNLQSEVISVSVKN